MEGPTPVSALIHAATLVVAGVFLIIRCSVLFEHAESVLFIVSAVGASTSFFAASVGLFQNDLKRVIAYSTCSQLGYMIFISGLSHYSISLFHLANHAVFKALLFLSAGCIIHGLSDEQDLRKMGSLFHFFPISYATILIGSLALVGFPFLTGFYSKDCILEIAIAKQTVTGNFCHFLGSSAAFCTSFYSFRLIFLTFVNKTNAYKFYIERAHEAPFLMIFPLLVLSMGAIFYGFLTRDFMIGLGSLFFNSVFTSYYNFQLIDAEFLNPLVKNIPFFFTFLGALCSLLLINCFNMNTKFIMNLKMSYFPKQLYVFLNKKWFFDQIFNELFVMKFMNFGYFTTFIALDKGLIEQFGPTGFTFNIFSSTYKFKDMNSGFLHKVSVLFIMSAFFFSGFFLINSFKFFALFNLDIFYLTFCYVSFFFIYND